MRHLLTVTAITFILTCPLPGAAQAVTRPPDLRDFGLAARMRERIAAVPGAEVAVSFRDLATGDSIDVNAATSFHAASTMKIPVMLEVLRAAEQRRLSLHQEVLLVNRFHSIVDGSPYSLDPAADGDSVMYRRVGERVPVRELVERMIVRSSNLATNALIALVGAEQANATARGLGARRIEVLRGVEDGKAYAAGRSNTTTSADLAVLLQRIEGGSALRPESVRIMKDILLRQEFNDEIPAGVPVGTPVAHKTGAITATLHDAAIVYPADRGPYILVVLTRAIRDEKVARSLIVDLSRMVWESTRSSTKPVPSSRP